MNRGRAAPFLVAVAGLAILGTGQGVLNRHAIEDTLTSSSVSALRAEGIAGTTVTFSGRDARIVVAGPPAQAARATAVVRGIGGVRVASARVAPGPPDPAGPLTTPAAVSPADTASGGIPPIGLTFENGVLTITGSVSSDAVDAGVVAILAGSGQWAVVDRLLVNPALPQAGAAWIQALGGLAAAVPADSARTVARFDGGRVIVRGAPATAAIELDILAAAATTVGGKSKVTDGLDVP